MKAIELNVPDDVYQTLQTLASHDHQSIDAFALQKLQEFAHNFGDFKKLEQRAQRGNQEKFLTAMAKVPKVAPMPGDEL